MPLSGRRTRRKRVNHSSDEDFDIDNASVPQSRRRTRRKRVNHSSDEDFDIDNASVPQSGRRTRRKRVNHSSDEDFEIDNPSSSLELLDDDDDDESFSEKSASEDSDLEDEEVVTVARSVPRSRTRAGRSVPGSAARRSRKRNMSSDGSESSLQLTDSGVEAERARRRSSYGVARRNARIDASTDEISERRKGKRKVVELEVDEVETRMQTTEATSATVCGICLSEGGTIERGKLDCCDHFFCFGCIMEWAKVESRCPMCKQRFATIGRTNTGGSKRIRAVRIPLRDQVYMPPDDEVPIDDPYSDTVCMECHETGEEGLLLLCDRCDSAAHTYCVGLGRSVPRGDWFCRSCQNIIAEESSDSEYEEEEMVLVSSGDDDEAVLRAIVASTETGRRRTTRQEQTQRAPTSAVRPVASSRRTRRARSGVRRRLWRRLSRSGRRRNRSAAVPRLSQAARDLMRNTESAGGQHSHNVETQAGPARTVPQQRRLQERIQIMRNNWERIQEGALQFTAIGVRSAFPVEEGTNVNAGNIANLATQSANELDSTEENRSSAQVNASSNYVAPTSVRESLSDTSEIKQAWRMMEQAKNISSGASSLNAPQHLAGAPQDLRAVSKQKTGVARQPAGSAMKTHAGLNGRASSSTIFMAHSRDEQKMKTLVASNRTDNRVNTSSENPEGIRNFEIVANAIGDRGKSLVEVGNRQLLNRCKSSGPVIYAALGESGDCSKHAIGSSATNTKETGTYTSVVDCSVEEFESQDEIHYNLVNLEKQGYTKCETGKVNISGAKELGNLAQPDYFAHLPSHASVERVGGTAHEEHVSAAGDRDQGCSSHIFYDEKEHLVKAGAAASASSLMKEKGKTESLKDYFTQKVKTELWPLYLSEGLGRDQFRGIARSSVHTLVDLYGSLKENPNSNQSRSLSCGHAELQKKSPIAGCCDNCITLEVEKIVKTIKANLQAR